MFTVALFWLGSLPALTSTPITGWLWVASFRRVRLVSPTTGFLPGVVVPIAPIACAAPLSMNVEPEPAPTMVTERVASSAVDVRNVVAAGSTMVSLLPSPAPLQSDENTRELIACKASRKPHKPSAVGGSTLVFTVSVLAVAIAAGRQHVANTVTTNTTEHLIVPEPTALAIGSPSIV